MGLEKKHMHAVWEEMTPVSYDHALVADATLFSESNCLHLFRYHYLYKLKRE